MEEAAAIAGPSRSRRKPAAPHPGVPKELGRRKLRPPLPPSRSTIPSHPSARGTAQLPISLKPLQGLKTRRTDTTRPGYGREEIFVTRKTGLGLLIGRCRSLVMDEGYTRLTFHAITAAIPQALLLLHALLDVLPYPTGTKGMWYEIHTGSVECIDEVELDAPKPAHAKPKARTGEATPEVAGGDQGIAGVLRGIGGTEAEEPERRSRTASSIRIDLHISPPRPVARAKQSEQSSTAHSASETKKQDRPNRPSKKKRLLLRKQRSAEAGEPVEEPGEEEEAMNEILASARPAPVSGKRSAPVEAPRQRKKGSAVAAMEVDDGSEASLKP